MHFRPHFITSSYSQRHPAAQPEKDSTLTPTSPTSVRQLLKQNMIKKHPLHGDIEKVGYFQWGSGEIFANWMSYLWQICAWFDGPTCAARIPHTWYHKRSRRYLHMGQAFTMPGFHYICITCFWWYRLNENPIWIPSCKQIHTRDIHASRQIRIVKWRMRCEMQCIGLSQLARRHFVSLLPLAKEKK